MWARTTSFDVCLVGLDALAFCYLEHNYRGVILDPVTHLPLLIVIYSNHYSSQHTWLGLGVFKRDRKLLGSPHCVHDIFEQVVFDNSSSHDTTWQHVGIHQNV